MTLDGNSGKSLGQRFSSRPSGWVADAWVLEGLGFRVLGFRGYGLGFSGKGSSRVLLGLYVGSFLN